MGKATYRPGRRRAPEEVERLIRVFESLSDPGAEHADKRNTSEKNQTELDSSVMPAESDLRDVPQRACVAFAVRCAVRVNTSIESLDEGTRDAVQRAIGLATEYAGGKDCDSLSLEKARKFVRHATLLQKLEGATSASQNAVSVAFWSLFAVWAAQTELRKGLGLDDRSLVAARRLWQLELSSRQCRRVLRGYGRILLCSSRQWDVVRSPLKRQSLNPFFRPTPTSCRVRLRRINLAADR